MNGASRTGVNQSETIRLSIQFKDQALNFVDPPAPPTITIVDPTNTVIISANSTSGVIRQDVGLFYYDFIVPQNGMLGSWSDIWSVSVNNRPFNKMLNFVVNKATDPVIAEAGQEIDVSLSEAGGSNVLVLMKLLRARLGSEGIRHKRDQFGRYLRDVNGNFIDEPCNVFTTDELYRFLQASLAEFNSIPHFTAFTFNDTAFVDTFKHELTEGAVILGLASQALKEKGREFQITDDALSYQPPMIADFLKGFFTDFLNSYRERIKMIKCSMKPAPIGFGSAPSLGGMGNPSVKRLRHLRSRQII